MSAPTAPNTKVIRDFLAAETVRAARALRSAQIDFELVRRRYLARKADQAQYDRARTALVTASTERAYVGRLLNAYPTAGSQ